MLEPRISGIPCLVEMTYYVNVKPWKGSAHNCPSDLDYYGYTEVEFEVFDRKGYKAGWLENKLTSEDRERIELELIEEATPDPDYDYEEREPDDF